MAIRGGLGGYYWSARVGVHAFVGRPLSHQVFFSQRGKLGDEYQLHCWSRNAGPESS
jgi:hypothetical protein